MAGLFLFAPYTAEADDCPTAGVETSTVAEALDGDTLRLADGATVRLAGIEAPKPPLSQSSDLPWPPAEAAREGLGSLVAGVTIHLAPAVNAADRYGRRHAFLFLAGGRSVQSAMVEEGYARARWLSEESQCFQTLLTLESAARKRGVGCGPIPTIVRGAPMILRFWNETDYMNWGGQDRLGWSRDAHGLPRFRTELPA